MAMLLAAPALPQAQAARPPQPQYLPCTITAYAPYEDGILTHHQNATAKVTCGQYYRTLKLTVTLCLILLSGKCSVWGGPTTFSKTSSNEIDNLNNPVQGGCAENDQNIYYPMSTVASAKAIGKDGLVHWSGSDTAVTASTCG